MEEPQIYNKNKPPIERVHLGILYIVRITLLLAIAAAITSQRWTVLFVSILTFLLTFLPHIFERRYKINIPIELEIVTVVFIYAALFLGEVQSFYARFWWWDVILHTGSAIAFGFIGFMILFVMDKSGKIKARPITIAMFSFAFALAIGAIWEIFEFAMDQIFGLNMQKNGLVDTMWDLIVDAAGAIFASTIGYIYLKKPNLLLFNRFMKKFIENNPNLFRS